RAVPDCTRRGVGFGRRPFCWAVAPHTNPLEKTSTFWNRFGRRGVCVGGSHMPGDPEECRRQGRECVRLAQRAATPRERQEYLSLAQTWLQLADIFESDDALLKRSGKPGSNV